MQLWLRVVICLIVIMNVSGAHSAKAIVFNTIDRLKFNLVRNVLRIANDSIRNHGKFYVGLSGGSMSSMLNELTDPGIATDWCKWIFVFVDERCVPLSSTESNFNNYSNLFTALGIDIEQQVLVIDSNAAVAGDAFAAAQLYNTGFNKMIPSGKLHLSLLGMGPDGHTASLFPGHSSQLAYEGTSSFIPVTDSPKPPSSRITLTLQGINSSENIIFVVTGAGKAEVVAEMLTVVDETCTSNSESGAASDSASSSSSGNIDSTKESTEYRVAVNEKLAIPASLVNIQGVLNTQSSIGVALSTASSTAAETDSDRLMFYFDVSAASALVREQKRMASFSCCLIST